MQDQANGTSQSLPFGLMQDWPLTVDKVIDHALAAHNQQEVVTRSVAGPIVRKTYGQIHNDARRVSEALLAHGMKPGDMIATMAWNSDLHMETWFGTMGLGMVLHTLNPRLFPQQIAWIANHAEDKALFFDTTFLPLIEAIAPHLPMVKLFVIYGDDSVVPEKTAIPNLKSYESFLSGSTGSNIQWGGFDERTACGLCYTSGTTGNPKGVLYSHRSNVLHTLMSMQSGALGISSQEIVLPIVPMFHANAWGLTFSGPASGAKLVMPGCRMDGEAIYELLDSEKVTISAAVPTVWQMLHEYLVKENKKLPHLNSVVIGGAATPEGLMRAFEEDFDVQVFPAWGMTETSPLGTVSRLPQQLENISDDEKMFHKMKQGRAPFGMEMDVVGPDGKSLPRDGVSAGHLKVRGPAVASAYLKGEGSALDERGFFDTGDVANIDEYGQMHITDRSKDVIKSGGEWISSIALENICMSHPKVAIAGAIGIHHPKWDERPLMVVQLKKGESLSKEEVISFYAGKIAKWWTPDDVVFVDEIPLGSTGKINKLALRETFKDYKLPDC
ncbi:long-chain-fatty-acid--CoA ligase [Hirschia litorea]|uniref:Long-chain-fatty-acid--CoA ligase n=1 Tax=Hirschia litorea TaxID=1199156 RepID=A0ABW2IIQ1_9PROT